ncbi:MAG: nucleoside 2-deoxyribosyltransferase [Candidatus Pacebacteria bacterium]|nr:nucleoside 2-deoxyribosyltransferase [Candidatus Paceibacterota bacterium]
MKIYFAGSIRAGREDWEIYSEIIKELQNYGHVLTEHIGQKELSDKGESLPFEQIYQRDMKWLKEADVMVAEITTPSLGVGYEIGVAEGLGKRILCLYREVPDKRVSGMILGNSRLTIKVYTDHKSLQDILKEFFIQSA